MSTNRTYIVGVGITHFSKQLETSVKELVREAVTAALKDAGCGADQLQGAYFATAGQGSIEGQYMVAGQIALGAMGISGIPVVNVENACASSSSALNAAQMFVASGAGDICLAVGVDKLFSEDKAKSFAVFDGARRQAAGRLRGAGQAQHFHGYLCQPGTLAHENLRDDTAPNGSGRRQEPCALDAQSACAVSISADHR